MHNARRRQCITVDVDAAGSILLDFSSFFKKDIRIRRIWDGALVNKPREVADSTRGRDEESNKIFWQ